MWKNLINNLLIALIVMRILLKKKLDYEMIMQKNLKTDPWETCYWFHFWRVCAQIYESQTSLRMTACKGVVGHIRKILLVLHRLGGLIIPNGLPIYPVNVLYKKFS